MASKVLSVTKSPDVVATLYDAGAAWGLPASVLTDNGCIYTAAYRGGYSAMESELFHLGIDYKHSRPYHPETCGKVEPLPPDVKEVPEKATPRGNGHRAPGPGRSLRRLLQRCPATPCQSSPDAEERVRLTRQSSTPKEAAGLLERAQGPPRQGRPRRRGDDPLQEQAPSHRHGRALAGTRIVLLVAGRQVRIIDREGTLLRDFELDPHRDYQPRSLG